MEILPPGHIQAQHPVFPNVTVKPVDLQLTITPAQSPEPPEEFEPSLVQQVVLPQSLESPKEIAPSPTQQVHQESQDQPPEPQKDQVVTLQPPGQDEAQHSNLPSVTLEPVDLQVTITPEPTEEGGPSPVQYVTPAVPPEPAEEVKHSATQQESLSLPTENSIETGPSPVQQESPVQFPEPATNSIA
nr:leucine-rich repeat-containing protein 37B-like [Dasypus novemcinctus]